MRKTDNPKPNGALASDRGREGGTPVGLVALRNTGIMYYVLIQVLAAWLRALPCFRESTGRAHSPAARATNVVLAGAPEARGPLLSFIRLS